MTTVDTIFTCNDIPDPAEMERLSNMRPSATSIIDRARYLKALRLQQDKLSRRDLPLTPPSASGTAAAQEVEPRTLTGRVGPSPVISLEQRRKERSAA